MPARSRWHQKFIQLSPDGSYALIQHSNQAYVAALMNTWLSQQAVSINDSALPLVNLPMSALVLCVGMQMAT